MTASTVLPPDFLVHMERLFRHFAALSVGKNGKYFNINTDPRHVDLVSRQTLDVAASPYNVDGGVVPLYVANDNGAAVQPTTGPFVLTEEPAFISGLPTNSSTFYGLMAWGFMVHTERLTDAQVNSAMDVLESAFVQMKIGNTIIGGPVNVGENIGGSHAGRISSATTAGEIMGTPYTDRMYHLFPAPLVVEPLTTFRIDMTLEGTQWAANSVTDLPLFKMVSKSLVADGAYNLDDPNPNDVIPALLGVA